MATGTSEHAQFATLEAEGLFFPLQQYILEARALGRVAQGREFKRTWVVFYSSLAICQGPLPEGFVSLH